MNKPKFSIVMIGRNERKTLPRMAGSLKDFFERGGEAILVDTGSTDGTSDVARDLGFIVYEEGDRFRITIDKELCDKINEKFIVDKEEPVVKEGDTLFDFASARNYAATKSSNSMICTPDCDEAYTTLNIDKINELIDQGVDQFEYNFVFAHDAYGQPLVKFMHSKFYNKDKISWSGCVHEVLQGDARRQFVEEDIIYLEHWQNHETNRGGYMKGLALDCYQNPGKDRQSHYFARECMYTGRWKTAIKEFERHVSMNRWPAEAAQSMLYIGNCHMFLGDNNQAEYWYHRAMMHDPSRREAFFACGEMYHKAKDYQKSSIYFAAALQIPWHGGFYGSRMELYKQVIHLLQSVNYFYLGKKKESLEELLKAYEQAPHDELILNNFKYVIEFPPVSIVIPNYKRNVDKLVESLNNDNYFGDKEIVIEVDKDGVGCPITLNKGVSNAKNDFVVFLGDDCEIEDKNWLNHAMIKYQTSFSDGVGLVALNDGMYFEDWKPKLACHWLGNKKLLPLLIDCKFFNEEVKHYGCDDILTIQCQKFNKLSYAENAKIKHHQVDDETKKKAKKSWKKDQEITNSILNLFK